MASLQALVQQFLSTSMNMSNVTVPDSANATSAPSPFNLGPLLSLLLSFSALRDWLKLIVVGGLLETCRRVLFRSYDKFIESFFITANFQEDDSSYGKLSPLPVGLNININRRLDDGLSFPKHILG
jgi:chaperone BCS1